MKINEFTTNLNTYLATVRVVLRNGSTMAKTHVIADGVTEARLMLTRIYGDGNVLSITQFMSEDQYITEATKTLSPQELQVKSLSDKAKQITQQKKQLQANQAMLKAQEKMRDAKRM